MISLLIGTYYNLQRKDQILSIGKNIYRFFHLFIYLFLKSVTLYVVSLGRMINNAFFGESTSKLAGAIRQKQKKAYKVMSKLGFSPQHIQQRELQLGDRDKE